MAERERRVLHVLPHAGGGGETYVDTLGEMRGYRAERVYVTALRKAPPLEVAAGIARIRHALRGKDLVHVHGEGTAALLLPLLAARTSVVTLHGLHLLRRSTGIGRRAAEVNVRAIVRAASGTICVSNAERDALARAVGHRALRRVVVVHNGARVPPAPAPADRSAVREELRLSESEPVAIWVGALDERRDPFVAMRAALRTDTALLFVGDGPLRTDVERVARPPVRVLGQRRDVSRLLGAADFFVLASEREGLSFGLLEAMAHALPAIVTAIPENVEPIGDTGIAVPYRDEEALVAAFRRFAANPAERASLGQQARALIVERFDATQMVERTRALYDEVLAARPV